MLKGFVLRGLLSLRNSEAPTFSLSIAPDHNCYYRFSRRFLSSDVISGEQGESFTVSYLIKSCGLAPDVANRVTKKFNLKSADKADAVLSCLRLYGFTDTHITKVVQRLPSVLVADPEKTLAPKMQLFASLGATPAVVAEIVQNCPEILKMSFEKNLAPTVEYLKSLFRTDENVVQVLQSFPRFRRLNVQTSLEPNVAVLREHGMPEIVILRFVMYYPGALFNSDVRFNMIVQKVTEMGFDPKKYVFIEAATALSKLTEENWGKKCEAFRNWGWSDIQFLNAFLKKPKCMNCSKKKIDQVMDFLVNTMGFTPSSVAEYPLALTCSQETIISRCTVIKILTQRCVIKRDQYKLGTILRGEARFLKDFVKRHEDVIPELFELYSQSKKEGRLLSI